MRDPSSALEPVKSSPKARLPDHYIMNLPDSALSFLPSFQSSYTPLLSVESFTGTYPCIDNVPMPLIHVYCFTREMEYAGAQVDVLKVSYARGPTSAQVACSRTVLLTSVLARQWLPWLGHYAEH